MSYIISNLDGFESSESDLTHRRVTVKKINKRNINLTRRDQNSQVNRFKTENQFPLLSLDAAQSTRDVTQEKSY